MSTQQIGFQAEIELAQPQPLVVGSRGNDLPVVRQHGTLTGLDLTCPLGHDDLFETAWVEAFCRHWNESGTTNQPFSSIGAVNFEVTRLSGPVSTLLFWDVTGMVSVWTGTSVNVPRFTGSPQAWADLICGERTAVASVLCKALIYRGPIAFAIRNGHKFDRVAEVARQMAHPLTLTGGMK